MNERNEQIEVPESDWSAREMRIAMQIRAQGGDVKAFEGPDGKNVFVTIRGKSGRLQMQLPTGSTAITVPATKFGKA